MQTTWLSSDDSVVKFGRKETLKPDGNFKLAANFTHLPHAPFASQGENIQLNLSLNKDQTCASQVKVNSTWEISSPVNQSE